MGPAMVTYYIALVVLLSNDVGIVCHQIANIEKGCLYSIVLEHSQDLRGIERIGAIIKRQRDFG